MYSTSRVENIVLKILRINNGQKVHILKELENSELIRMLKGY